MNNKKKLSILGIAFVALAAILSLNMTDKTDNSASIKPNMVDKNIANTNKPKFISIAEANIANSAPPKTNFDDSQIPETSYLAEVASPTIQMTESMNPIDRIKAIQNKTALHEAILKDHDEFTRYPEYNARFERVDNDPTVQRYELDERTTESKEDHTALTIWSDKKYYLHNDTVTVYANLRDQNGRIIPTQFIGQLIYNEQVGMQELQFVDKNLDGVHEATFNLSSDPQEKAFEPGVYKVLIVNKHNQLADAVSFTLSKPELALSGNYRDKLVDGSLLIEAEVKVEAKNRYYFQASLYTENGDPIGSSQHTTELTAGTHWIPLSFDGLMIRDSGEDGSYTLKNISFAKVALPIQRAPLKSPDYLTQSYELEQFRGTRYAAN